MTDNKKELRWTDISHPFDLGTMHLSLQGLGSVLSQRDGNGKSHTIANTSRCLHPKEQLMYNYSLVKLELLMLKCIS